MAEAVSAHQYLRSPLTPGHTVRLLFPASPALESYHGTESQPVEYGQKGCTPLPDVVSQFSPGPFQPPSLLIDWPTNRIQQRIQDPVEPLTRKSPHS